MMIAFVPFPTAVMSENGNLAATGFYALMMILASSSGLILWWHAARNHNLIDPHVDKRQIRREASVAVATIAIFVLSIAVAFFDTGLARICWMSVFPVALLLRREANKPFAAADESSTGSRSHVSHTSPLGLRRVDRAAGVDKDCAT